jgi:hypothetical protein
VCAENVHVFEGSTAPAHCTLKGNFLEADPGNLCIQVDGSGGIGPTVTAAQISALDIETLQTTGEGGAGRPGLVLVASSVAENSASFGTWAVTG